ncbi:MAG: hypothetical protein GDA48_08610 [Hormoscilla sp. GM102CHS1]|nr:hypothetical protein [Hormoscilla sp. GM102CHS1]
MLRKNTAADNIHPYREALHTLLSGYPEGLSAIAIASQLGLSEKECDRLLHSEQMRDAIEADPYSGKLLFRSKSNSQPGLTLEQELERARQKLRRRRIKVAFLSSLLSGAAIALVAVVPAIRRAIEPPPATWAPEWIQTRAELEIAAQKRLELEEERSDLAQRLAHMKSIAAKADCSTDWSQEKTCYLEGRLLSRAAFDRELAQMRLRISQLDEILSSSTRS